jgi:hypothetical protein
MLHILEIHRDLHSGSPTSHKAKGAQTVDPTTRLSEMSGDPVKILLTNPLDLDIPSEQEGASSNTGHSR